MKRVDLLADSSIVECLMMDVLRRHVRMLKRVAVAMVVALAVGAAASAQTNGSGAAGASGQAAVCAISDVFGSDHPAGAQARS